MYKVILCILSIVCVCVSYGIFSIVYLFKSEAKKNVELVRPSLKQKEKKEPSLCVCVRVFVWC